MILAAAVPDPDYVRTLDLAALAGVDVRDVIEIRGFRHRTIELFEVTQKLVDTADAACGEPPLAPSAPSVRYLPQEADLRARFKLAEALGSYATLNSLLDRYAPAYRLTHAASSATSVAAISANEIAQIEDYRDQIEDALRHAAEHLASGSMANYSATELSELNAILHEARARFHTIESVLGMRLIHDVELGVQRLAQLYEKTQTVQRTVSGIFLVDSEVMFLPAQELVRIVEAIFKAIGNPFVVAHIDGTLLLAARNLLIQVVSFYSYYGREQIYQVMGTHPGKGARGQIATCIRAEIKLLFAACKASNKLILTRVMDHAEREFELSIEAIQIEATKRAIVAVERLIPVRPSLPLPARHGVLRRLARWLFRSAA